MASGANTIASTLVIVVDDDASVANSSCRLSRLLGMRGEAFCSGAALLNSGRATETSCSDSRMCAGQIWDRLQLQRRLLKKIRPKYSRYLLQRQRGQGRGRPGAALRCGGFFCASPCVRMTCCAPFVWPSNGRVRRQMAQDITESDRVVAKTNPGTGEQRAADALPCTKRQ